MHYRDFFDFHFPFLLDALLFVAGAHGRLGDQFIATGTQIPINLIVTLVKMP